MWKYGNALPVANSSAIVSLNEGNTPLLKARLYPRCEVFLKNETVNPTGSHKDRALSIGITKALEFGFDTCMLYSDGSAALSSAAYAARAGIRNITLAPAGTPESRLLPLMIYDSIVLEYQGSGAEALAWVHEACQSLGIYETTTYRRANPYESEGPKTISYEIAEDLGRVPDWVVVPVGGGGTLSGIWRGFVELKQRGVTTKLPRMAGVLPAGYRLLELGMQQGAANNDDLRQLGGFEAPESAQAKIAMTFPPDGLEAIAAIRDSGGLFLYASDAEALAAQQRLGAREGIYAEVSATAPLVAIDQLIGMGLVEKEQQTVAIISGSGFRETGELGRSLAVKKNAISQSTGIADLKRLLHL
jgi:threonine synthase